MAAALSIGEYNQLYLKHLFSNMGTPHAIKAAEVVADYAPEYLTIDGVKCRHWVSLFDAEGMQFAYRNPTTRKLVYKTLKEIKQLRENHGHQLS